MIRQTFQATDSTVQFKDFQAFATTLLETYCDPATWRIRPGIPDLLADLEQLGCPMAVVSNFDHRLPELLQGIGLKGFFRSIRIPSQGNAAKPDRAVFETLTAPLERRIDQFIYVGDDDPSVLEEIAGYGIRTVDIHSHGASREILEFIRASNRDVAAATVPA